ncbi:MAG: hypothetical protein WBW16_11045 [Bacteroidota bacterium]
MTDRWSVVLAIGLLALLIATCEQSTDAPSPGVSAIQVPGCTGHFLKTTASDSCFSYQFHDALVVDFCAGANCCPDSNRFSFRHRVSNDTIMVTIADTAAHLCRCICNYVLHMEFRDLPSDNYVFFCTRQDYSDRVVFYSERVQRN